MVGYHLSYFRYYHNDFPQDSQLSYRDLSHRRWHISSYRVLLKVKLLLNVSGDTEEERPISAQDKAIQNFTRVKMKWWHWLMLILGSVMIVGGTIWEIII